MIIVAQRISTILHAEQILVMDEGRIVGKGTHEELMRNCEVYQQIARSQLSASELENSVAVKEKLNKSDEKLHIMLGIIYQMERRKHDYGR